MHGSVLVSIIIPVYNCAAQLQNSLLSLLAQSEKKFEVIFVDDKSTDGSLGGLRDFTRNHPDINSTILINEANSGEAWARNRGLAVAKGEFVCFIDADDKVDSDFIKLLSRKAAQGYDLVYCGYDIINSSNGRVVHFNETKKYLFDSNEIIKQYLFAENHFAHVGAIYRRTFLAQHKITYNEHCGFGVDIEFVCTVLLHNPKCSCVDQSLYQYIIRANSISTSITPTKVSECYESLSRIQKKLPSLPTRLVFMISRKAKTSYYLLEEAFAQKIVSLDNRKLVLRLIIFSSLHILRAPKRRLNSHGLDVLRNGFKLAKS